MAEGDLRGELIALEPGGDHLNVCDERWISFLESPIGDFC